uniref:Uncharacterized protein n=1 Tax=Solanum tuberosum TaxID=4113 RepID=M1CIH6_SOLTU
MIRVPIREHTTSYVTNKMYSTTCFENDNFNCSGGAHYSRTLQCYDQRKGGTIKSLCEKASEFSNSINNCFI